MTKIELIAHACGAEERIVEICLNSNVRNSATKDIISCSKLYDFIVGKKYIVVPDFAIESWKNEEDINYEQISELKAKVSQATRFLIGLKDTPDNTTIGDLRSFIEAIYENIIK